MAEERNDDYVEIPSTGQVLKEEGDGIAIDMGAAAAKQVEEEFAEREDK